MSNFSNLKNMVCYMTDINNNEFINFYTKYKYISYEEKENIKISKDCYNIRKLIYLSDIDIDPVALVYMLTNIDKDMTYTDSDIIEGFFNTKKLLNTFGG